MTEKAICKRKAEVMCQLKTNCFKITEKIGDSHCSILNIFREASQGTVEVVDSRQRTLDNR